MSDAELEEEELVPHILRKIHKDQKLKEFDEEAAIIECAEWLHMQLGDTVCKEVSGTAGRITACNCMIFITEDSEVTIHKVEEIARYMVWWSHLKGEDKSATLAEWKKLWKILPKGETICITLFLYSFQHASISCS